MSYKENAYEAFKCAHDCDTAEEEASLMHNPNPDFSTPESYIFIISVPRHDQLFANQQEMTIEKTKRSSPL